MIGIIGFGVVVGIFLSILSSIQKKNIPEDFSSNYVYSKFRDYEISIDEACKYFELLDI
jgi:hypothetical protein